MLLRSLLVILTFCSKINGVSIVGDNQNQFSDQCSQDLKWNENGITIIGPNAVGSIQNGVSFPEGLFIEPITQILYISDIGNNRVLKYYPNGEIVIAAGNPDGKTGSTPDRLNGPIDIFADKEENVYIADWGNQRIQLWEKNAKSGKTVAGTGKRGSALNEFSYPSRVWVDSKKNVIVADTQNERVMQWPPSVDPHKANGTIIAGGNGAGINPYQLNTPTGMFFDESQGVLYISNELSHSVTQWFLGDYSDKNIYAGIPGRPGDTSAQLNQPQGITFDRLGNLYITDCQNNRIQMFCSNSIFGSTVAGTGIFGNHSNQLYYPRDVAVDAQLNLYVSDTYNNRIQKFLRIQ